MQSLLMIRFTLLMQKIKRLDAGKETPIFANNGLEGVCAFANEDHICYKPSRAWKGQYNKLKEENKEA